MNTRVSGHELRCEGAAYRNGDPPHCRFPQRIQVNTVSGIGFGLCSCGAKSKVLDSANQSEAWHRDHKRTVTA